MANESRKRTGEIGVTRIAATPAGMTAEVVPTILPAKKADLESFFAQRFVDQFNADLPLGRGINISPLKQNATSDLDFSILSQIANYLELAELNPSSESFGRAALEKGKLNVYQYARWIFFKVIVRKSRKYGRDVSARTVLLLYVTHWQFYSSERVIQCLNSLVINNGCTFAAVFVMLTNGRDLRILQPVHPYLGPRLPAPRAYEGFTLTNLEPGHYFWKVNT